jgi:hypothetical protein
VDRIREDQDDGAVVLVDGSMEFDIDLIIIGTGYHLRCPMSFTTNSPYHIFPLA